MTLKKTLLFFLALSLSAAVLSSCGKKSSTNTTASDTASLTESGQSAADDKAVTGSDSNKAGTNSSSGTQTVSKSSNNSSGSKSNTAAAETESTTSKYKRTGTMRFSDSADNKYLAAVAAKYDVDASVLAAIYTVPDADGNLVLQFDGSKDDNGKLIRTNDTLIAIYSVDREFNCKRASEDTSLNEYSYGEMKVMFLSTEKYIVPKFETQLNGD